MKKDSKSIGLRELINRVKHDLLDEYLQKEEPTLFSIDEITLEINFTITGDIDSGFNLGVVNLGSQVSEERVQKVIIKMTPLLPKNRLLRYLMENGKIDTETVFNAVKGE